MAAFVKVKYGQVEPNHLSAQRNAQIYAQLPAAAAITVLENGQFAKYDLEAGEVNFSGDGEWMLVYNEVKTYDVRESYADFALVKTDATQGVMTPRLFKTNLGDIFTTNMVKNEAIVKGDKLVVGLAGILEVAAVPGAGVMAWNVVKLTTMPDGKPAVKLQRIV